MSKKYAIWGDFHCGIHQNSLFWHKVALQWADWFASQLEERKVKDIIFMGDFFDHRDEVAVNTLHVGYQVLQKLKDFNIIMIPGNHDSFYRDHSEINSLNIVQGWPNIQLLTKTSQLMIGNKLATFIPWGGTIDKIPKADYVFGHLEINTFRMVGTKVCEKGFDTAKLFDLGPKVYSGHFHLRQRRQYQENFINYVGNTFEMNFSDDGDQKGFYIIDPDEGLEEFVPNIVSPKHFKLLASQVLNLDLASLADKIKGNIIKLVIDTKISAEVIDMLQRNIILQRPATCTVEFLLNINAIDVLQDLKAEMVGVNIQDAITKFIENLEINDKPQLTEECLAYYKDIK